DTEGGTSALQHIALSDDELAAVVGGQDHPDAPSEFEPPPLIDHPTFGKLYAGLLASDAKLDAEQAANP
ncbi:MAG: hypothetical protein ABW217_05855, partial [Polyangiaceae bacterium]